MAVRIDSSGGTGASVLSAAAALVQGLNAARSEGQERQLQLLQLLLRDPANTLQPVAPADVQSQNLFDRLLGGGAGRTPSGNNLFNLAGQQFQVGPRPILADPSPATTALLQGGLPSASPPPPVPREALQVPLYGGSQGPAPSGAITSQPLPLTSSSPAPASAEPSTSPTLATRNNNPLNIKLGGLTQQHVDNGTATVAGPATDGGQFLKFTSPEAGFQAAHDLLSSHLYAKRTVDQALRLWSNQGYDGNLVASQIDPQRTMGSLTPDERQFVITAMAKREGWAPPSTRPTPTQVPQASVIPAVPDQRLAGPGAPQAPTTLQLVMPSASSSVAPPETPPQNLPAMVADATGTVTPQALPQTPEDRKAVLVERRIEKATTTPGIEIVEIPGHGTVLLSHAVGVQQQLNTVRQTFRKGIPEDAAKFRTAERQAWADAAQYTETFFKDRKDALKEFPWAAEAIKGAKSPAELQRVLYDPRFQIPAQAYVTMRTDVMKWAHGGIDSQAKADEVAAAIAHHVAHGLPEAQAKQLRIDTGLETWEALQRKRLEAIDPTLRQAKLDEEAAMGKQRTTEALRQKELEATSPVLQQAKEDETRRLARAQEGQRPRGTDTYLQTAQTLLKQEQEAGRLPADATIQDLPSAVRGVAHQIELNRPLEIERAKRNGMYTVRMNATEAQRYIHPLTAQRADEGMTPAEAINAGFIGMSTKQQGTVDTRVSALKILDNMDLMLFGGVDKKGVINGNPGEILPGILTTEGEVGSRVSKTVQARLAALKQNPDLGRLLVAYEGYKATFLPTFGRGVGGDAGHYTEGDAARTASGLATMGLSGSGSLQTSYDTAELQSRLIRETLNAGLERAVGPTRPPRVGVLPSTTPTGTPSATPPVGGATTAPASPYVPTGNPKVDAVMRKQLGLDIAPPADTPPQPVSTEGWTPPPGYKIE